MGYLMEKNRMILVDLDGVCADFELHRYQKLQAEGLPAIPPAEIKNFYGSKDYLERFGIGAHEASLAVTKQPGFFREMPPIPGAVEGMEYLRSSGQIVRICSKPLSNHPTCEVEKLTWVRNHLGPWWEERAIITSVKSEVGACFLIDDRPNMRSYIASRNEPLAPWKHVLFRQCWNLDDTESDCVMRDWTDFAWLGDSE
jgi:5'-nucleotidase